MREKFRKRQNIKSLFFNHKNLIGNIFFILKERVKIKLKISIQTSKFINFSTLVTLRKFYAFEMQQLCRVEKEPESRSRRTLDFCSVTVLLSQTLSIISKFYLF